MILFQKIETSAWEKGARGLEYIRRSTASVCSISKTEFRAGVGRLDDLWPQWVLESDRRAGAAAAGWRVLVTDLMEKRNIMG